MHACYSKYFQVERFRLFQHFNLLVLSIIINMILFQLIQRQTNSTKKIIYGCSELLNAAQFMKQVPTISLNAFFEMKTARLLSIVY